MENIFKCPYCEKEYDLNDNYDKQCIYYARDGEPLCCMDCYLNEMDAYCIVVYEIDKESGNKAVKSWMIETPIREKVDGDGMEVKEAIEYYLKEIADDKKSYELICFYYTGDLDDLETIYRRAKEDNPLHNTFIIE